MVQYAYKKYFLTIRHGWFVDDYEQILKEKKSDILICHGVDEENIRHFDVFSKQATLITDLTEDLDPIFSKFNKNYRYEIRRAEKENVEYKVYVADEMLKSKDIFEKFISTYNQMYKSKGMKTVFNTRQILSCIAVGCIVFTVAFHSGAPLVFHSYIFDKNNVRFYYSASPFRVQKEDSALIARMNKGLHWHDICLFKKSGISRYDWGGYKCLAT